MDKIDTLEKANAAAKAMGARYRNVNICKMAQYAGDITSVEYFDTTGREVAIYMPDLHSFQKTGRDSVYFKGSHKF